MIQYAKVLFLQSISKFLTKSLMTPEAWLYILIFILLFDFCIDWVLGWLNFNYKKQFEVHSFLKPHYDETIMKKTKEYQRDNFNLGKISSFFSLAVFIIVLFTGFLGKIYDLIVALGYNNILTNLLFFALMFVANDILSLPFELYKTFVIEEKHGFNKTTLKLFWTDKLKAYGISIVLMGVLLSILFYTMDAVGQQFWIIFWLVAIAFMLLANMFFVSWIMPLFNKFTPINEGELFESIKNYCQKVNFPISGVFVIDGSKRSTKANAFFSGIGKTKKVVFYDTLINNHSKEEILSVLAHEVGHYKKRHIYQTLIISVLNIGLILFLLSFFAFDEVLSKTMGAQNLSYALNLIVYSIVFSPLSRITGIAMNFLSRKNEYEADDYAKKTFSAQPLAEALVKLSKDNLSNPNPHPYYVFVNYSHPTVSQRIEKMGL
ncbi:MAG: M48 family metallopeptidase [Cytophagales bacterium]